MEIERGSLTGRDEGATGPAGPRHSDRPRLEGQRRESATVDIPISFDVIDYELSESRRDALHAAVDPKARHRRAFAVALISMVVGVGAFLTPVIIVGLAPTIAVGLSVIGIVLVFAGLVVLVLASGAHHPWRQAVEYSRIMEGSDTAGLPAPMTKCPRCGSMNPTSSPRCARCGART